MKKMLSVFLAPLALLAGCGAAGGGFGELTPRQAKGKMDAGGVLVVDVREQDEYDAGHIPGAVLLPLGAIDEASAAAVIPAKDAEVLVYCRSGVRSRRAASALAKLGYTQVYDMGGILSWPYEVEK